MKKVLSILSLGCILFTTSCDDKLLEPFAPGALTEDIAVQTPDDLQSLMNTAYASLTPLSEIEFSSVFTDEVGVGYNNGGQGKSDYLAFLLNSASGAPNGIWDDNYATLAYVNRVIKFSQRIDAVDAADQEKENSAVAQALAIRAYCHIQLISYFSTNPKDRNALGVMLSNDVYPSTAIKPRETNGVIYDQIDQDLNDAEALFNTLSTSPTSSYANKTLVIALKARVNALRGDYANALTYADDVINNSGLSLATFSNYKNVFHTDDNGAASEVIFKLKKLVNQTRTGGLWASVNVSVSGSPFYEVGRSLFNLMNTTGYSSATTLQVSSISGANVFIPGNTLVKDDMVVFNSTYPANAVLNNNGTATIPANSIIAGKVYYVKAVNSNGSVTLTPDPVAASPATASFAQANTNNFTTNPISVTTNYGDIRYTVNVHPTSWINPNYQTVVDYLNTDKITVRKYPGTAVNGNFVNDIKLCRLSEMYFIKAEALVSAGDLAGAAAVIKQIRDARTNRPQVLPTYANATDAWKDILKERRIEFAFEGYRFIDLKRLGSLANEGINRDARDCEFNGACTLPTTDYRFALPMPQDETKVNPLVKAQQNPGYAD